jgi:phenylacetate-CoA ligase
MFDPATVGGEAGRRLLARLVEGARLRRYPVQAAARADLQHVEWATPGELATLQQERLARLIRHAYDHVPYYRQLVDERGLRPANFRSAGDLVQLPILTKRAVRDNVDLLRARAGNGALVQAEVNYTGGSTGVPLRFYQNRAARMVKRQILRRNFERCGYRTGERIAFLWITHYNRQPYGTQRGRFAEFLDNRLFLDVSRSSEAEWVRYARQLAALQPKLLVSYSTSLARLARVAREHGITGIRPGAIQSTAELLTAELRSSIESAFGCPVFDRYGSSEMGDVAHECDEHRGLHVHLGSHVVEVLVGDRPANPGEVGRVVVTDLINFAMPFIRYELGDQAVLSDRPCPCGRPFPLLERIVGRQYDVIQCPSGRVLHGAFLTHLFFGLEGVREFQVVQKSLTNLEVYLNCDAAFQSATVRRLEWLLHTSGDPAFVVHFDLVDNIPRSPSGKLRFIRSELPTSG